MNRIKNVVTEIDEVSFDKMSRTDLFKRISQENSRAA